MSQTIKTYSDLCEEREKLKNLLIVQKQRMRDDWDELKHEFVPVKNVFGVLGKMARPDKSNPLMNAGLKVATDMFISSFVLGKAGWVTKMAVPFVVRNYSSHLMAEKGRTVIEKIAKLLSGRKVKRKTATMPTEAPMTTPVDPVAMTGTLPPNDIVEQTQPRI